MGTNEDEEKEIRWPLDNSNKNIDLSYCEEYLRNDFTSKFGSMDKEHDKTEKHAEITEDLREIYKKKNKDYGDSFSKIFETKGLEASVIRFLDKVYRIDTLSKRPEREVEDETIRDSLMDLANYVIMTIIELDLQEEEENEE